MFCSVFFLIFVVLGFPPGRSLLRYFCEKFKFVYGKGYILILSQPTVFLSYFRGLALSGINENWEKMLTEISCFFSRVHNSSGTDFL